MKRNLVAIVLVLLFTVAAIGFVRGWFVVSRSDPNSGNHKVNVNLTVDPDKVRADADAVKAKTVELSGGAAEETKDVGHPKTDDQ